MEPLRLLIPRRSLQRRVRALAAAIAADYEGRDPVLLGVLKGAYVFLADLARRIDSSPEVDFIQVCSYGMKGTTGSKRVKVTHRPGADLRGRDVLVVEDIVDSGRTLRFLLQYLARLEPSSVAVCALLVRSRSAAAVADLVDYKGFEIGDGWVVGYGLDCAERYRSLPEIHVLEGR